MSRLKHPPINVVWKLGEGGASSSVILAKITKSVTKSPRVAEQCDVNIPSLTPSPLKTRCAEGANARQICRGSNVLPLMWTATGGSDVVQSGRPIFDDFFQHLWPYIGNNTVNVVFQMVKRLWLIRIDQ
ncbi:hypothetical protein TNCV_302191 [Trichonephila clavipes]|nr:hypothetical protein TNCV_302191 [Trichonephila clavipes]